MNHCSLFTKCIRLLFVVFHFAFDSIWCNREMNRQVACWLRRQHVCAYIVHIVICTINYWVYVQLEEHLSLVTHIFHICLIDFNRRPLIFRHAYKHYSKTQMTVDRQSTYIIYFYSFSNLWILHTHSTNNYCCFCCCRCFGCVCVRAFFMNRNAMVNFYNRFFREKNVWLSVECREPFVKSSSQTIIIIEMWHF